MLENMRTVLVGPVVLEQTAVWVRAAYIVYVVDMLTSPEKGRKRTHFTLAFETILDHFGMTSLRIFSSNPVARSTP
jgi:hypothetical protein